MAFTRKTIEVTITIGGGNNVGSVPTSTMVLTGYRVQANLQSYGGDSQGTLQMRIYGVSLDLANQLTCIGPIQDQVRGGNSVQVAVGDWGDALTTVFIGTIDAAWANFRPPDMCLEVTAYSAGYASVLPISATSFNGFATVDQIMTAIVNTMNLTDPNLKLGYKNNGVSSGLTNVYLPGTGVDQIRECAKAANIDYNISLNTLTISPKDTPIPTAGAVPIITPQTGLVGYPTFSQSGIELTTAFLPNIKQGSNVIVQGSVIVAANATWFVRGVNHDLESETPGGAWFTQLTGTKAIHQL